MPSITSRARPRDLLRAALAVQRLHQPCGESEHVRDGVLGAALAQLLERLLEWIVVGDPRGGLDHLAERPVRDALAVRERASDEDARPLKPSTNSRTSRLFPTPASP